MARRGQSSLRRVRRPFGIATGTAQGFRLSTFVSRLLFLAGLVGAVGLLGGFVWFADNITTMKPVALSGKVDGAVVLTGGSNERLTAGLALLEEQKAERLLISGVNKVATREELRLIIGGNADLWACCIDIGKQALDTVGNAREISNWTASHSMTRIALVTDSYHLPRSLVEVRRAVPRVAIVPYPVVASPYNQANWWTNERASRGLALEYGKFLVANIRAMWFGLSGRNEEGGAE
jgi:uncharacterized SAM-binding protein YcdF (DUF218 family)